MNPSRLRSIGFRSGTPIHRLTATRLDRVALALLVASLFLERWDKEYYLSGRSPVPDLFFVAAGTAYLLYLAIRANIREAAHGRPVSTEVALAGLMLVLGFLSLLALAVGPFGFSHLTQVGKTFVHLAFLLSIAIALSRLMTPPLVTFALRTYFAIAACLAGIAILEAIDVNALHTGISGELNLGTRQYHGFLAPLSIYSEPAYLGYASLQALLIGLFLTDPRRSKTALAGILLCAAGLVLSASAGALAVGGTIAVYLLVLAGRRRDRRTLIGIILLICVAVAVAAVTPVGRIAKERMTGIWNGSDPSAQYRRAVDEGTIKVWRRSPFVGVGLGDTRLLLPRYVHLSFEPNLNAEFSDANAYLGLLAETGPLGVLAFLAALAVLGRRSRQGGRLEDLTRTLVIVTALECLVIGAFVRPAFWVAVGLRSAVVAGAAGAANGVESPLPDAAVNRGVRTRWPAVVASVLAFAVAVAVLAVVHRQRSGRVVTSVPTTRYGNLVLADHPLGYWRLSGRDGSPAGRSPRGSLHGLYGFGSPGAVRGDSAGFLSLVRGALSLPYHKFDFAGRAPFTLEIWAKSKGTAGYPRIISKEVVDGSGASGYALLYDTPAHALAFVRLTPLRSDGVYARLTIPTSRWSYLAATYDGVTMRLYVDGNLAGEARSLLSIEDRTATLQLGTGANWYWHGGLDEAAIYDRALPKSIIRAHYLAAH